MQTEERKKKRCKSCKAEYSPMKTTQQACSPLCAIELVREKEKAKREKAYRAETKRRKQALKTKSEWLSEAQAVCNRFIRMRDRDEPCISCGRYDFEIRERYTGGKWDAGHFKTRGAYPELRFHPANIHKQCKSCNGGSGKYVKKNKTVSIEYKERLIERISHEMVEYLEGPQEAQHWTIDDIKEIKAYYAELVKIMKKTLDNPF